MTPRTMIVLTAVAVVLMGGAGALAVLTILPDEKAEIAEDGRDKKAALMSARIAIQQRRPLAASITYGKTKVVGLGAARAVCGEVDVEEPDDGMDGLARFTWVEDKLVMEELDGTEAVTRSWSELCD